MNEKTVQESKATEMSDIEKQVARAREVAKRRSEEPPVEVGDSYENPNFKLALQHLPRGYRLGLSTNPAAYGDPKQDPKTIRPDQLPTHTL